MFKDSSIKSYNHSQAKRFENLAYLSGAVAFVALLKFPMIRVQPGFKRVGISAALAYPCYALLYSTAQKMKLKRSI